MDSPKPDVELIQLAIQNLIDDNNINGSSGDNDQKNQLLLSRLMSEIKSLREDEGIRQTNAIPEQQSKEIHNEDSDGTEAENIVKELKEVKRQNSITHWLLVAMIVLTVGWQISEISMIWRLQDGMKHPFRSVGSMLNGLFKDRDSKDEENQSSPSKDRQNGTPSLQILDMPNVDLSNFTFSADNQ